MLLKNVNFKYILFFHGIFTVIVFIIKFKPTGEFNFKKWICLDNIIILLLFWQTLINGNIMILLWCFVMY
jgi:hypothetical protein